MTDDDLRARLRASDPAAALAPAAPDQIARLLEETMSTRSRRPLYALAAAALILLVAGFGWTLTRPEGNPPPRSRTQPQIQAQPQSPAAGPGVVVKLTGAGPTQGKCMEPSPALLKKSADFAFAGTVTGITAGVVRLDVTRIWTGGVADTVEVAQADDSSEQMLGSGKFEPGEDYLVASSEGVVMICGYSGEADAIGLRDLYDRAF